MIAQWTHRACRVAADSAVRSESPGLDEVVDVALGIGRDAAAEYKGLDPREVALQLGVAVCFMDGDNVVAGRRMRAEYDSETRVITVYRRGIRELEDSFTEGLMVLPFRCAPRQYSVAGIHHPTGVIPGRAESIAIAHEMFHHLASTAATGIGARLAEISRGRRISVEELAAHAFAQEMLGLPVLPSVFDR